MEDMVDGRWGILGVDNIGRGREEDEDEQLGRGQKKNGEMIKYAVKFSRPNSARLPTHTVSSNLGLSSLSGTLEPRLGDIEGSNSPDLPDLPRSLAEFSQPPSLPTPSISCLVRFHSNTSAQIVIRIRLAQGRPRWSKKTPTSFLTSNYICIVHSEIPVTVTSYASYSTRKVCGLFLERERDSIVFLSWRESNYLQYGRQIPFWLLPCVERGYENVTSFFLSHQ